MNSALLPSLMAFAIIALAVYILVREVGLYLKSYSKGCGVDYSTDKILIVPMLIYVGLFLLLIMK